MPSVLEIAKDFRNRILARDADALSRIAADYLTVYKAIKAEADRAMADLDGAAVSERVVRLNELEGQAAAQLQRFGVDAASLVTENQRAAVTLGSQGVRAMLEAPVSPGALAAHLSDLPISAIDALVGFASDGSPLKDLFVSLAPEAAEAARDTLLTGLALGHGPEVIAGGLRDTLGVPLTRALRISRTETMRAYREATHQTMEANAEFTAGWYWQASGGSRTCPVCWAMDGTFHLLSERFASHVSCRCTQIPAAKLLSEVLGDPSFPDDTWRPAQTGEEAFAKLDPAKQLAILGPGKYALYAAGKLRLSDLVERGEDARWGPYRIEKPLKAVA
jgi:SPP1 gp7 family putative phage head morphogenesis protein